MIRRLLEMAEADRDPDLRAMVEGGLRADWRTAARILRETIAAGGPRADEARAIYPDLALRPLPDPDRVVLPRSPRGKAENGQFSWDREDAYDPPDFDAFFPDDPEGGRRLDALWKAKDRDARTDEEVLKAVRDGLRRAESSRFEVLRWVGGRFVQRGPKPDPRAMEILYQATDFLGDDPAFDDTRHAGIYFGLSLLRPIPPNVLRTFADLAMRLEDPNDLDRIAWASRAQKADFLARMRPYLDSPEAKVREKAEAVSAMVEGRLNAWNWAGGLATKRVSARFGARLPTIREALSRGDSAARLATLEEIEKNQINLILDDSFLPAFVLCAGDADSKVRKGVAEVVGGHWDSREAVDLEKKLAKDPAFEVRLAAIESSLAGREGKTEEDVRLLVDFLLENPTERTHEVTTAIGEGLAEHREIVARILEDAIRGDDPARAKAARRYDVFLVGRPLGKDRRDEFARALRDLHEHLGRVYPMFALKQIDWEAVGQELLPRASEATTEEAFGRLVLEMVARLEDTHAVVQDGSAHVPMPKLPEWEPGLACLVDDRGKPVVYDVAKGSEAEKKGLKPGMTIVSVDGMASEDMIARYSKTLKTFYGYSSDRMLNYDAVRGFLRADERGAKRTILAERPDGSQRTFELACDLRRRYLPRLPVPIEGINDSANVSWKRLNDDIGYIYVRRIANGLEADLDAVLKGLGDVKKLVLDLRGNSGGGFDTSTAFRNFDPDDRDPARPHFLGPIAILIDERTVSAGEGWASWFVAKKRAKFFGSTSAGASSRKEVYTLTDGLYKVVVPVKAYNGFLDRPIERRGLEPDVPIRPGAGPRTGRGYRAQCGEGHVGRTKCTPHAGASGAPDVSWLRQRGHGEVGGEEEHRLAPLARAERPGEHLHGELVARGGVEGEHARGGPVVVEDADADRLAIFPLDWARKFIIPDRLVRILRDRRGAVLHPGDPQLDAQVGGASGEVLADVGLDLASPQHHVIFAGDVGLVPPSDEGFRVLREPAVGVGVEVGAELRRDGRDVLRVGDEVVVGEPVAVDVPLAVDPVERLVGLGDEAAPGGVVLQVVEISLPSDGEVRRLFPGEVAGLADVGQVEAVDVVGQPLADLLAIAAAGAVGQERLGAVDQVAKWGAGDLRGPRQRVDRLAVVLVPAGVDLGLQGADQADGLVLVGGVGVLAEERLGAGEVGVGVVDGDGVGHAEVAPGAVVLLLRQRVLDLRDRRGELGRLHLLLADLPGEVRALQPGGQAVPLGLQGPFLAMRAANRAS